MLKKGLTRLVDSVDLPIECVQYKWHCTGKPYAKCFLIAMLVVGRM